jgi:hypothetical protein
MKNFKLHILSFLAIISQTGCSSLNGDFYTNLKRTTPYLKSSSAIVTRLVLSEAVSKEDREKRAKTIVAVAEMIEEMTKEGEVDLAVVMSRISYFFPDESNWGEFSSTIILIYADFHAQAQTIENEDEKRKVLILALNKIAAGCRAGAKYYYKE